MDEKEKNEEEINKKVEEMYAELLLRGSAVVRALSLPNSISKMRNLLSVVTQNAYILTYRVKPKDDFFKHLKNVLDYSFKIAEIVTKISNSYLHFSINKINIDLNEIINSSQPAILEVKHEKIQIKFNLNDGPLVIHADVTQIIGMLLCLLTNIQNIVMPNGGILEITTCSKVQKKDYLKWVEFNILPVEHAILSFSVSTTKNVANFKESLFSAMFSPSQKEDKMKLSNAMKILYKHDGEINIIELDKGAIINIYIPTINLKNPKNLLPKL